MKSINRNYCKGQVIVIFALSLIVLVGMVGLAIDSGRAYGVKAKLSAAVDAAAIAAARGLTVGATDALRIANAKAAAQKFFNGNFPPNYFGVTSTTLTIPDPVHNSNGYWDVKVLATANMPTTFIRVLNWNQVNVDASGEAIRRDLDMVLVLDNSLSLTTPTNVFPAVKSAAQNFIGKFIPSTDRVGLVSFGYGAVVNVHICPTPAMPSCPGTDPDRGFNKADITTAISSMTAIGSTASAEGMRQALNEINAIPSAKRSSLRVIVFFSDGAPNTIPATFTRTSGSPNPITGDLFSEIGSGAAPQSVFSYGTIKNQLTGNPPSLPNANIATLPIDSGTLTITDTGATPPPTPLAIPLYDSTLTGQRSLGASPYTNSRCNVNKAARNMLENVANKARSWKENGTEDQPIAIYSLGLGDQLNSLEVTFCGYGTSEYGSNIMKKVANTADSDPHYNAPQPTGLYCYAADSTALDGCFNAIASDILRLTK